MTKANSDIVINHWEASPAILHVVGRQDWQTLALLSYENLFQDKKPKAVAELILALTCGAPTKDVLDHLCQAKLALPPCEQALLDMGFALRSSDEEGCAANLKLAIDVAPEIAFGIIYYMIDLFSCARDHKNGDFLRLLIEKFRCSKLLPESPKILSTFWTGAIGHISFLDSYIKAQILGHAKKDNYCVLLADTVNHALYKSFLDIGVPTIIQAQGFEGRDIKFADPHVIQLSDGRIELWRRHAVEIERQWVEKFGKPLIALNPQLRDQGWATLNSIGIARNSWFATLHVREGGFHHEVERGLNRPRNGRIETYIPAIQRILDCGGHVIRMGDGTMTPLPEIKGLLDYALSPIKSDEMDIFLAAETRLHIGTNSGMSLIPALFRRPLLGTNWTPITQMPWFENTIILPKRWKSKNETAFTQEQMLDSPFREFEDIADLEAQGILLIDNSPDDIVEGVEEMLSLIGLSSKPIKGQGAFNRFADMFAEKAKSRNMLGRLRLADSFIYNHADFVEI